MTGTLFIASTPIGNLEDITYRAVRILKEVDVIACEDTRRARILLDHYSIPTRTISYHEHNESERAAELSGVLRSGASVALISDAGTPCISDPGFRLVSAAIDIGARVIPVPGPAAFLAALTASGLPASNFFFGGFLPPRSGQRRARLAELSEIKTTLLFYEAPHRLLASLKDTYEVLGQRKAVIAREITKIHEEIARGLLTDLIERFSKAEAIRGEIVVAIDAELLSTIEQPQEGFLARIAALETNGVQHRDALKKVAKEFGLSRSEAYRRLISEKNQRR